MYNYKIAYSNYDEYSSFELTHEKKFTKEEFHKIVEKAIKRVYEQMSDEEKSFFDRIGFLFLDYKLICELHKFGFKNLEYEEAIELENVNLFNYSYPICGPKAFFDSKMEKCEHCNMSEDICGVKNSNLDIICTEYGTIAKKF